MCGVPDRETLNWHPYTDQASRTTAGGEEMTFVPALRRRFLD